MYLMKDGLLTKVPRRGGAEIRIGTSILSPRRYAITPKADNSWLSGSPARISAAPLSDFLDGLSEQDHRKREASNARCLAADVVHVVGDRSCLARDVSGLSPLNIAKPS